MTEATLLLPEICLAFVICAIICGEVVHFGETYRSVILTTLLGLGTAFVQTILGYQHLGASVLAGIYTIDGVSQFFRIYSIALATMVTLLGALSGEIEKDSRSEFSAFVCGGGLLMCVAGSSRNLLVTWLALQGLNLVIFILIGYSKQDIGSIEAAVKYMIFSLISSALLAIGVALLFLHTGTLDLESIRHILIQTPLGGQLGVFIFSLFFFSLAFFCAVFPMHFWFSDVLQGAPTPAAAFIGLGAPAVGFVVGVRIFSTLFSGEEHASGWSQGTGGPLAEIVLLSACATMVLGSLLAFRQRRAKRLLANLLVMQNGFLLAVLTLFNARAVAALFYHLLVALFALGGLYGVLSIISKSNRGELLSEFRGVFNGAALEGISLIIFLACILGFPPFPGYIGKFLLIGFAIEKHEPFIALLILVSGIISIAAFSRFLFSIVGGFVESHEVKLHPLPRQRWYLFVMLLPTFLLTVFAEPVLQWVTRSFLFIF